MPTNHTLQDQLNKSEIVEAIKLHVIKYPLRVREIEKKSEDMNVIQTK